MDASFADIAVVVACTQGVLVLCADKPITLTPFTCPLFAGANGSFTIDGANGSFTIAGANGSFTIDALPPVGCWCFNAFVRRFVTGTSRFLRGCSTGNTRRLFLGSFDRAYEREEKTETNRRKKICNFFSLFGMRITFRLALRFTSNAN